jgi:hypothetical protein
MKQNITIWVAIAKDGYLMLFTDKPTRTNTSWEGNYYVNSVLYGNVKNLIGGSNMTFETEPEPITFTIENGED